MPKKRVIVSSDEEDVVKKDIQSEVNENEDSHSSSSSVEPQKKKTKKSKDTKKVKETEKEKEEEKEKDDIWAKGDGDSVVTKLSGTKQVSVKNFKGKIYVDIRDFYEKNGKMLPTKKGISLNKSDWVAFKDLIEDIDVKLLDM